MEKEKRITIYTDGACSGNPGRGGYGVVMLYGSVRKEMSAAFKLTTNNRMELLAVIEALNKIKHNQYGVDVFTDSKYVCDAIEKGWLFGWVKKGFKDKKNVDLWKLILPLLKFHNIKFHWVKGHAGHPLNERCDELAVAATEGGPWAEDTGYLAQK